MCSVSSMEHPPSPATSTWCADWGKPFEKTQKPGPLVRAFSWGVDLNCTMSQTLLTRLDGGVMTITLNRPDVFNSFNQDMGRAFQKALDEAASNADVRCVVVTGRDAHFVRGKT